MRIFAKLLILCQTIGMRISIRNFSLLACLAALLLGIQSRGEMQIDAWEIQSNFDKFKLTQAGDGNYSFNKKIVDIGILRKVKELFTGNIQFEQTCGLGKNSSPDVTITAITKDKKNKLFFYIEQKLIRNSENRCVYLSDSDLSTLPLHRTWFNDEAKSTIAVDNKLQLFAENQLVFDFEKTEDGWNQNNSKEFPNWEYFDNVLLALKDFSIDGRAHDSLSKGKPGFELRTGRQTFSFYLVGKNLWAAKLPKIKWLVISNSWALFENYDLSLWRSKYSSQLSKIVDESADTPARIAAVKNLGVAWSPNIKKAFHSILLNSNDSEELKFYLLKKIKRKPTNENMIILTKSLDQTENTDLQMEISKILRLMNPKGPIINPNDPEKINEHIQYWQKWGKSLRKAQ